MQTLLPVVLKFLVLCGFVLGVVGFYQQVMFSAAWRREQYDRGLPFGLFTLRVFFASISRSKNLSDELRMRRRKYYLCLLAFFVCLGLMMVTLEAMRRLSVTS
jgi:hypothetical protein